MLIGTAIALHTLSSGALERMPNATLSMGVCDTHWYLALMLLVHFKSKQLGESPTVSKPCSR